MLLVIFFHAGAGVPGGFIGVDVFFVISGYLITGIILPQIKNGEFRPGAFLVRRIRRIVPAQLLMTLAVVVSGSFLLMPADFRILGESVQSQMLLVSNVFFYHDVGYFDAPAELQPLLHTWSLAVEEQFYLALPLILMLCQRISPRRITGCMVMLACCSFAISVITSLDHPAFSFYLLPSRAWELLLGGLVSRVPVCSERLRKSFWWITPPPSRQPVPR